MYSKNNKKMNDQKQLEKVNQYGIKKFNVGTASVLVAAGFAFLGGGNALASNDTAVTSSNEPATPAATATAKEETPAPTVGSKSKQSEPKCCNRTCSKCNCQSRCNRKNSSCN